MAKLAEILSKESERPDKASMLVLHFFKDGNFYHAYEFSAWLMKTFLKSDLKVVHRKSPTAEDGSFVFVGYPVAQKEKHIPADSSLVGEDGPDIAVRLSADIFPEDLAAETLLEDFRRWKQEQPFKEPPPEQDKQTSSSDKQLPVQPDASFSIRGLIREALDSDPSLASITMSITITRK